MLPMIGYLGVILSSKIHKKGVFFKLGYEHGIRFGREWLAGHESPGH